MSDDGADPEEQVLEEDYFQTLPEHVLEAILKYLPDRELANLSSLNTATLRLSNRIIRSKYLTLLRRIDVELESLQREIEALSFNHTGLLLRIFDYRSYVAFEFLRSEMRLLRSLGRGLLFSPDKAVLFARVTPGYQELFFKAKARNLSRLKVNDDLINKIIQPSKLLITKIKNHKLTKKLPLGSRMVDLLDCLIKKEYQVMVKFCFHPTFEFVLVDATYHFIPLNLYSPPMLTRSSEEREKTLGHPDESLTTLLMDYLFNVIRLNNKSYLKEASYEREEEFNNRRQAAAVLQHGLGVPLPPPLRWLNQPPTSYSAKDLSSEKSFHRNEESFWVKHKYKTNGYTGRLTMNRKGKIGIQVPGLHNE